MSLSCSYRHRIQRAANKGKAMKRNTKIHAFVKVSNVGRTCDGSEGEWVPFSYVRGGHCAPFVEQSIEYTPWWLSSLERAPFVRVSFDTERK